MTPEKIAETVLQIVIAVVHDYDLSDSAIITQNSSFSDIGIDQTDMVEILHRTEQTFHFEIPDDVITEKSRVCELTDLIIDLLEDAREARAPMLKESWLDFPGE